jgi:hypothetical protein
MRIGTFALGGMLLAAAPGAAHAQVSLNDLQSRVQTLEEQVRALRAELEALKAPSPSGAPPAPTPAPVAQAPAQAGSQTPAGQLPVYGAAAAGSKIFNPDIGMIGNFISATGRSRGGSKAIAPLPGATLQESEASFQAIVDPYARADFFLAIGEDGIEVEEGYVTFTTLPGAFLLKAGKMRATFGRLNAFHNHTLPWIDRPLAMYNLLGGSPLDPDAGIKDAGVSVSRLIPAGTLFMEATGEVYRGDSGTLFTSSRRSDVSAVGHLRASADLTDQTNLELGGSYARGHNEGGSSSITQLYGADVTLRWRPLSRAIYRSLAARTEVFWSRREQEPSLQSAFGGYASLEYQFRRRWFAGGRYDWSDRATHAAIHDRGTSAVLTFWPSEFSQVRGQYRRTRYGDDGRVAHEVLFQTLFTIGAHGAHPF